MFCRPWFTVHIVVDFVANRVYVVFENKYAKEADRSITRNWSRCTYNNINRFQREVHFPTWITSLENPPLCCPTVTRIFEGTSLRYCACGPAIQLPVVFTISVKNAFMWPMPFVSSELFSSDVRTTTVERAAGRDHSAASSILRPLAIALRGTSFLSECSSACLWNYVIYILHHSRYYTGNDASRLLIMDLVAGQCFCKRWQPRKPLGKKKVSANGQALWRWRSW